MKYTGILTLYYILCKIPINSIDIFMLNSMVYWLLDAVTG